MEFLSVQEISKTLGNRTVLHPLSFSMAQGKKLAIAGATGSGKSTLLKIIAGLVQPDGGSVRFEGKKVFGPDEKLMPGHAGIGYLSQHFELRNNYTVGEELEYANALQQPEANAIYAMCDVAHLLQRGTNQVSGGEKQRIVTARLLTTGPRLLLLDEPYSNLDGEHRQAMKSLIENISTRLGLSIILVSHEPMDTLAWADEVLVLQDGRLVQQGPPQQVYHQPASKEIAALFGSYALLSPGAAALFQKESNGEKNLLVRPGDFVLRGDGDGVKATVESVAFLGSHYEVTMAAAGFRMQAVSVDGYFQKGESIFLSLKTGRGWWV